MFLSADKQAVQKIYPWCNDTAIQLIEKEVHEKKLLVAFPSVKRKDLILWRSPLNEHVSTEDVCRDFDALRKDLANKMMLSSMASALRNSMTNAQMNMFQFYGALTAVLSEAESLFRQPRRKTSSKLIPIRMVRPPAIHAILNREMNMPHMRSNVAMIGMDEMGMAKTVSTFDWRVTAHEGGVFVSEIGT